MLQAVGDKVVVLLDPAIATQGSLRLPDTAIETPCRGTVCNVGDGFYDTDGQPIPWQVKRGDRVLLSRHAGSDLTEFGHRYKVVREADILAIETASTS